MWIMGQNNPLRPEESLSYDGLLNEMCFHTNKDVNSIWITVEISVFIFCNFWGRIIP